MVNVFLHRPGEYQYVVQTDKNRMVQHVSKDIVNQSLKNCRGIGQANLHYQVLVMACWLVGWLVLHTVFHSSPS